MINIAVTQPDAEPEKLHRNVANNQLDPDAVVSPQAGKKSIHERLQSEGLRNIDITFISCQFMFARVAWLRLQLSSS